MAGQKPSPQEADFSLFALQFRLFLLITRLFYARDLIFVQEPENPTNPAHEKVGLGEEILTSQNEARQSRDRNPELPQKNTAQRSRNQIW
jgi:hypothetical protein